MCIRDRYQRRVRGRIARHMPVHTPQRRISQILCHLEAASSSPEDPPTVNVDSEGLPPQPFLKECSDRLGGVFIIRTPSGKERVVATDPSLAEMLFYPDETNLSRMTAMRQFNERAFGWRGGGMPDPKVMDDIRRCLLPAKAEKFAMNVGVELCSFFKDWPSEGQRDLFDACHGTLYPVSTQLFGAEFSQSKCPQLRQAVIDFDKEVAKSVYQAPLNDQAKHLEGRADLVTAFETALANKCNTKPDCPLGMTVYGPKEVPAKWGKYGISNVWAAQGNTIPATFWTIALILNDSNWREKVVNEVRAHFQQQPNPEGEFDISKLVYLDACFKEALRLKATGAEFRTVMQDHVITSDGSGRAYQLRKGQELYNSSYFTHHDPKLWDRVEEFVPERWLAPEGNRLPQYAYMPFGAGLHVCAGRFLAKMEIVIFVALLLRDFDCELATDLPGTIWENAIGVVRPDRLLPIRFKRV
eukprot:TRINITY_DN8705_c0_g1_i19.p1 TRINITY_DN8705_c0_g1~~TRINITY_DN8705_c0_g1_i19.p1  ORF type:complete len:470 (-),score=82.36 TRINITY_DN8705_c0_g1_i19:181-1590(-)